MIYSDVGLPCFSVHLHICIFIGLNLIILRGSLAAILFKGLQWFFTIDRIYTHFFIYNVTVFQSTFTNNNNEIVFTIFFVIN